MRLFLLLVVFQIYIVSDVGYRSTHRILYGDSERYPLTSQLIQENKIPEFGRGINLLA